MLYHAISLGSQIYHLVESRGHFYDEYFCDPLAVSEYPADLDERHARRIIAFINSWSTRFQASPQQVSEALRSVAAQLNTLRGKTIATVDLGQAQEGRTTVADIRDVFRAVATCGPRYEATGASKILHLILPELLMMWDEKISAGYAVGRRAEAYASSFLPRVQRVAWAALREIARIEGIAQEPAASFLCKCTPSHTLAKVLDEYNYVKYTLRDGRVWEAEYAC